MPQNVFDGNVARRRIPRFSMCRASRFDDEGPLPEIRDFIEREAKGGDQGRRIGVRTA
jgi:hypothetical protein